MIIEAALWAKVRSYLVFVALPLIILTMRKLKPHMLTFGVSET